VACFSHLIYSLVKFQVF